MKATRSMVSGAGSRERAAATAARGGQRRAERHVQRDGRALGARPSRCVETCRRAVIDPRAGSSTRTWSTRTSSTRTSSTRTWSTCTSSTRTCVHLYFVHAYFVQRSTPVGRGPSSRRRGRRRARSRPLARPSAGRRHVKQRRRPARRRWPPASGSAVLHEPQLRRHRASESGPARASARRRRRRPAPRCWCRRA